MKVNQIVGEHKKGFRANIYRKKKVIAPQSTEIHPMEEDGKITKSDSSGVEITAADGVKTILPPEKATALAPDPQNPNEYDLNPAAVNPSANAGSGSNAPKVGATVDMTTSEAGENDLGTTPTKDFVKGIYSLAAEHGSEAPNPEEVKKMMVLAPNGEVDNRKTFEKIMAAFQQQLPKIQQLMKELDELIKKAEANPELARMQELAGMTDEDVSAFGVTQHDNGDMSYSSGPMSIRKNKDGSSDTNYDLGMGKVRVQQNPIGVKTLSATGDIEDQLIGTDASAQRLGVDPSKVRAQLATKESAELTAMLTIAGLR